MRKFLLIALFACVAITAFAVAKPVAALKAATGLQPAVTVKIKNDSSKLAIRNFDLQKLKSYRERAEFKYDNDTPAESWWGKFWRWFWGLFKGVLKSSYSVSFIKYGIIAILAAMVIFVIFKLLGLDLKIILGKSKSIEVPFSESLDNIHEINFSEEIQQAITNGNYRLAVRLCYLSTLKKLNDRSLISWQPEKTNRTYIEEITDPLIKQQFTLLTTQFEYIWYGEFFIDKENFSGIKNNFDLFNPEKR